VVQQETTFDYLTMIISAIRPILEMFWFGSGLLNYVNMLWQTPLKKCLFWDALYDLAQGLFSGGCHTI